MYCHCYLQLILVRPYDCIMQLAHAQRLSPCSRECSPEVNAVLTTTGTAACIHTQLVLPAANRSQCHCLPLRAVKLGSPCLLNQSFIRFSSDLGFILVYGSISVLKLCFTLCLVLPLQIIQVNLTSEGLQPIASGTKVEFTYSVTWAPTPIHFSRRFERYLDYNFFEHQVCILCLHPLHSIPFRVCSCHLSAALSAAVSACTTGPEQQVLICALAQYHLEDVQMLPCSCSACCCCILHGMYS